MKNDLFLKIKEVKGDIVKIDYVEAIVNAANNTLLGGGGVDGAIHKAAGSNLLKECMTLHGCKTGEAKITKGYNLPCNYVIHAVGPRWTGGKLNEEQLLKNCYINSLEVARKNNIRTIAFPSISTGIYGYPVEKAAKVAVNAVKNYLEQYPNDFDLVTWVLFDDNTKQVYQNAIKEELSLQEDMELDY